MDYRRLGRSGLQVSVIGLGSNQFGRTVDAQQTSRIIHHALDLGINFIDTADIYADTQSELFIGQAIRGRRDAVVLATKTGAALYNGVGGRGLSRRRIITCLEDSLRRLGTDYLDVYYLHWPDPHTPIAETLRVLDDLVTAGKIRYWACSNYDAWQIAEMLGICEQHGYARPVVSQSLYNLVERQSESDLIPACAHFGLGLVPYFPLGGGFLTGKYRRGEPIPPGVRGYDDQRWQQRYLTERNFRVLEAAEVVAQRHGWTVADVAIAWLLAKPIVCSVIAGARRVEQVTANVAAGAWQLSADEVAELERDLSA